MFVVPNTPFEYSVLFFLQLTVILSACKAVGWVAKYFGQPQVVAEMIAGVLLGPSLLGLVAPEYYQMLFPEGSRRILFSVSQVGLALYMFIVGVEFRADHFLNKGKTAIAVSISGMLTPFVLGGLLAIWLHADGTLFPSEVTLYQAMLFMGASMCITAFPMLARIIVENGLSGTVLGTLAIAAAAIDDVAAWCVLAIVVSSKDGNWLSAITAIGGGIVYAMFVLGILRPALRFLTRSSEEQGLLNANMVSLILLLVMLGAFTTDRIGVYAVFGAFLMGCAMPRGNISNQIRLQFEPLTLGLLLPLFFTYSGLNTRLDLVSSPRLIGIAIVVLAVASLGKGVACWAAARLCGESSNTSIAIGALMNARGLMELILLNIAKDKGLIGPELFSILVVMAIVTTLAATPVFRLVQRAFAEEPPALPR
jgi:Kef-type K+ transport system membrane component KefB